MLNRNHKVTGIAYCDHKNYGGMLVVLYAGDFKPNELGTDEVNKRNG